VSPIERAHDIQTATDTDPLYWGIGLLEETYDAVIAWELGGTIRFWNRGAERLYGYDRQQAVGRVVHELLAGAPDAGSMADVEMEIRERGRWQGELRRTALSGGQVRTETRILLARRAEHEVPYVLEASRDVTVHRDAEEVIRRERAVTAGILDAAIDAIVGMDHLGRITSFNAAAEGMFGWRREEVIGRELGEVVIPEHLREAHRAGMARYLSTGVAHVLGRRIEIDALRADGTTFPVELAIAELSGTSPPLFTGFLRDITERRQQEDRLRKANEELESRAAEERALRKVAERLTAATQVPDVMQQIAAGAIVVSGAAGAYVERVVSPEGEVEVLGVAGEGAPPVGTRVPYPGSLTEEIVGRREPVFLTQLVGVGKSMAPYLAEHCPGCSVLVIPLLAETQVLGALVILRRGSEAPFEFGVVNRARTLGDLASLALQRVLTIEEAERRRDEAEGAVRTRDDVLSIVSHDLRNPVSTIVMSASLLGDPEIDLDEAQRSQQLGVIKRSGERATRLIQDLLDVGRMEGGRFTVRCHRQDPAMLVRECCDAFTSAMESKAQQFRCEVASDLPPIDVDRDRILQVLSNFLGNATKFTPAGGRIAMRAWRVDGEVRFAVEDSGPGIAEEDRQRIFQRFWQAKRTAHLGAGLGLAIAKGIADAHRGRVWVESRLGEGSTFVLAVPAPDESR